MPTLRSWIAGGFAALAVAGASPAFAQSLPAVTIGGGLQSSYQYTDRDDADGTNEFLLNSARLYVNGTRAPRTSSSCSTPSTTARTNAIGVLDAVAQISTLAEVQRLGRPLPAAERSRQPVRPVLLEPLGRLHRRRPGRLSVRLPGPRQRRHVLGPVRQGEGVGRRCSTASRRPASDDVLFAGRVQVDFWDTEDGYYLNGTYYGDKNLLAIGGAGQAQDGDVARTTSTSCSRRRSASGGAFTVESRVRALRRARRLRRQLQQRATARYILGAYLFPKMAIGPGQFADPRQVRRRRRSRKASPTDYDQTRPRSTSTTSSRSSTPG